MQLNPTLKSLTEQEQCDLDENLIAVKSVGIQTVDPDFLHVMPAGMQKVLDINTDVKSKWDMLTKLTQNEWICWVTIVKMPKTRQQHLDRLCEDLRAGKRRPCCWPGCPHRRKNAGKWFK